MVQGWILIKPLLPMKAPAAEIGFVVLVAFIITMEEAVAIRLLVSATAPEKREEAGCAVFVEMRTLRIITFSPTPIVRARKQAIVVTLIVGVGAISIVAIVRGLVRAHAIDVTHAAKIAVPISPAIMITMSMAVTISVTISISVAISVTHPGLRVITAAPRGVAGGAIATTSIVIAAATL